MDRDDGAFAIGPGIGVCGVRGPESERRCLSVMSEIWSRGAGPSLLALLTAFENRWERPTVHSAGCRWEVTIDDALSKVVQACQDLVPQPSATRGCSREFQELWNQEHSSAVFEPWQRPHAGQYAFSVSLTISKAARSRVSVWKRGLTTGQVGRRPALDVSSCKRNRAVGFATGMLAAAPHWRQGRSSRSVRILDLPNPAESSWRILARHGGSMKLLGGRLFVPGHIRFPLMTRGELRGGSVWLAGWAVRALS